MIKVRALRVALGSVLVVACATGSAAVLVDSYVVSCGYSWGGGLSLECDDPRTEAAMRARMLTGEQAREAGCPGLVEAEPAPSGEPGPTYFVNMDPPSEPPVPARATDPAVTARVNAAWDKIERWLAAHASATLRKLSFPASPRDVDRWERNFGGKVPDALYASLLRHDGAEGNFGAGFQLPPDIGLMALSSYSSLHSYNCIDLIMAGSEEDADPDDGVWHGSLLPFASAGGGDELFIDPRSGRVGQKAGGGRIRYDGPMSWPSYLDLLEGLASALESGGPLREWYPTVTAGCELRWADEPAAAPQANCAGTPRPSPTPTPTPTPTRPGKAELEATGCVPPKTRPLVRHPGPAVTARVNAVWRRIERWLARKAPAEYKKLGEPAKPMEIARAEAAMGLRFPGDLRASLLRHDGGQLQVPPFYRLTSVRRSREEWKVNCDVMLQNEDLSDYWWHGAVIPFAAGVSGDNLFIDTRTGQVGEFFHEEGLRAGHWPSYLALLRATARALETGEPIGGLRPVVRDGRLDWESA
ncbi:SMI1/KNR4 family protein [Nonomuraea sp. NPDC005650]|uniref:SMI1/KNR4 family protein n=1 Tax=Nonomuraea sp. NPDC005650 TaxID=3157045 RepID=UPI0033BC260F